MTNLKTLFAEWNDKYFQGKLGNVSLSFYSRRSHTMGFFRRSWSGKSININTFSNPIRPRSEADQQHTLLHEMVHAYLNAINMPCGHTPQFKRMLKDLTEKTFGIRPTSNMRFVINMQGATLNRPMPSPVDIFKTIPVPSAGKAWQVPVTTLQGRYKIISSGKVGTFLKETMIYGKKHIVLSNVEGCLFPFTTALDNVVKV
jgi:hypothetical protein